MGPPESVKKLASRPKVNTIVITAKPTNKNNQGLIVPTRETTIDGNVNIPAPIMALMARSTIPKEPTERISLFWSFKFKIFLIGRIDQFPIPFHCYEQMFPTPSFSLLVRDP